MKLVTAVLRPETFDKVREALCDIDSHRDDCN